MALPGGVLVGRTESCPGLGILSASYGSHRVCGLVCVPLCLWISPLPLPPQESSQAMVSFNLLFTADVIIVIATGGAHHFNPRVLRGRVRTFQGYKTHYVHRAF